MIAVAPKEPVSAFATKSSSHLTLGLITGLVYKEPETTLQALEAAGLEGAKFISSTTKKHDTQAVVTPVEDAIVVSFRGTEHPTDVRTNMRFNFMPSPLGGRVHEGFYDALDDKSTLDGSNTWQQIMQQVEALAATGQYNKIYFTGHSLGGALATMATTRFMGTDLGDYPHAKDLKMAELVTFGQPKTFDAEGEKALSEAIGGRATRYVHRSDMVPFLPLFGADKTSIGPINIPTNFGTYEACSGRHYINKGGGISDISQSDSWKRVSLIRMLKPAMDSLREGLTTFGTYLDHHDLGKHYLTALKKEMGLEFGKAGIEGTPEVIGHLSHALEAAPGTAFTKRLQDYVPTLASVALSEMAFGEVKKPASAESWRAMIAKEEPQQSAQTEVEKGGSTGQVR